MGVSLEGTEKKTNINEPCKLCREERAPVCQGYCSIHYKEILSEVIFKLVNKRI
jgi:hypothetical protein